MFSPLFRTTHRRVPARSYSLAHELHDLQRHVDALLGHWGQVGPVAGSGAGPAAAWSRAIRRSRSDAFDVYEESDGYRLVADLPGMRAEDLDIEATEDTLTIKGKRAVSAPEGYTVHRRERESFALARAFTLPTKIDPEKVTATLVHGVLTITLAKREDAKPRTIAVRSAEA